MLWIQSGHCNGGSVPLAVQTVAVQAAVHTLPYRTANKYFADTRILRWTGLWKWGSLIIVIITNVIIHLINTTALPIRCFVM